MKSKKEKNPEENPKIIAVDLGCGQNKASIEFFKDNLNIPATEVIGLDHVQCDGVDIVHDLTTFPYPFEDNSIDAIHSSHFVEHLDGFERMKFFDECYRILKPGGRMRVIHPYYKSVRAIQDPTHKFPPISENSSFYWDRSWRDLNKLDHYPINCDFEFNIYYVWQDGSIANKNEETRTFSIDKYWNIVADMIVDLTKRN